MQEEKYTSMTQYRSDLCSNCVKAVSAKCKVVLLKLACSVIASSVEFDTVLLYKRQPKSAYFVSWLMSGQQRNTIRRTSGIQFTTAARPATNIYSISDHRS